MSHNDIIKEYGIVAKKSLGQNFLVNDDILEKIANAISLNGRNIIEVGPGYGALTEKIIKQDPDSITLVELDSKMVGILEDRIKKMQFEHKNLKIHTGDILKFIPTYSDYVVIANIPYYITSPILTHFFYSLDKRPSEMVILMQKDVADKIRMVAGNKRSVLSLSAEYACNDIKEVTKVGANNFVPPPKVESSVLHFNLNGDIDKTEAALFLRVIKAGFSERRKKLISNLIKQGILKKDEASSIFSEMSIDENARAEELNLGQWKNLLKHIK